MSSEAMPRLKSAGAGGTGRALTQITLIVVFPPVSLHA